MKNYSLPLLFCTLLIGGSKIVKAQYPTITAQVRDSIKHFSDGFEAHSDSMWKIAYPIVEQEAKEGKPYIPWAARPTDLPQSALLAFPGAEGGGAHTEGGRGGKVYVVTSLADHGPGSFREACEKGGHRTIVFNVAGVIHLQTPIILRAPYVTIEGQTAPGDGVCIAGESFWINTHDVILRYMRFRRGKTWVGRRDDALGGNPVGNIMIDHVSASWGLDENMSIYRHMFDPGDGSKEEKHGTVNMTVQNSISAESLDYWNHAFGSTMGGENCMLARNLWADNTGRNPSIGWNGIFNFVNNVVFNWHHRSTDGGDYTSLYNIINNYYKPGPVTPKDDPVGYRILKPESGRSKLPYKVFGRAYVHGNVVDGNEQVTKDNWDGGVQMEGVDGELMTLDSARKYFPYMKWDKPFPHASVTILPAQQAFQYVLNNVGATLPVRDAVDKRVVEQVRTGKIAYKEINTDDDYQFKVRKLPKDSYKLGIITEIKQVGGYPEYKGTPYKDSDADGMPDAYESKNGLNPNDPSDASKEAKNGKGYTNIEVYLNSVVPVNTVRPDYQPS
ncbi:Pectate lyase [Arachidicoccus rhizosphaerae]|uniref:Pectate lyase n=1 Tax=Arachidicoccus rhizosphaerae TaxID=551991 RepID=A0A1H3X1D5_9BACT|nr:polysaccharide lyase [Arachidicoccus rhizosphaerae]SDZ93063.1 Pectate lyase [Arachidicoccus rhizosphaerae]